MKLELDLEDLKVLLKGTQPQPSYGITEAIDKFGWWDYVRDQWCWIDEELDELDEHDN